MSKTDSVEVDFITSQGKKFCSVAFPAKEWEQITRLALERFINDALRHYLDKEDFGEKVP